MFHLYCILTGFSLNNALHQIVVARYSDHNSIDFDNFVCCLIRLESQFSECHTVSVCSVVRLVNNVIVIIVCVVLVFLTDTFKVLDKDGTGTIELGFMEVRWRRQKNLKSVMLKLMTYNCVCVLCSQWLNFAMS